MLDQRLQNNEARPSSRREGLSCATLKEKKKKETKDPYWHGDVVQILLLVRL